MRSVFLFIIVVFSNFKGYTQLFSFHFPGPGTCPTQGSTLVSQPPGVQVSSVTRSGVLSCVSTSDCFTSTGFLTGATADTNQFIEVSVTAIPGFELSLESLSFATSRNAKGPVNGRVAHDGGTGVFSESYNFGIGTTSSVVSWNFPDLAIGNGGIIKIRIYGWFASATAGTMRLDDIVLNGSSVSTSPLHLDYINGRIGIGTIQPTTQLHTTGAVRFTGLEAKDSAEKILVTDSSGNLGFRNITALSQGWKTGGNTGLAATDFLGTVDSIDLIFKRANVRSGMLSSFNTSFGFKALNPVNTGLYNTAVGSGSIQNNTTGISNAAFGYHSLFSNTSGNYNTGLGDSALVANVFGNSNIGVGAYSLYRLGSTGLGSNSNVAIGTSAMANFIGSTRNAPNTALGGTAMLNTTSGDGNTAIGAASMFANTTGYDNTALGYWSLRFNTTGRENLAIGTTSLRQNTTGIQNVGIGREALRNDSSGNGNVGIGYQVGYSNFNGSRNVFIGFQAGYSETGSNKLYIANSSTSLPLIYGDFITGRLGIGTNKITDTAYKLFVESGIRTRKIKVDALVWADYVFDKEYKLLPLNELSSFIELYKHLPGIQTSEEVKQGGVDLGENQALLLRKIEELTLYILELDKKLTAQDKRLAIPGKKTLRQRGK